jgi:polyisoprenoid-binding protein YceI
MRASRAARVATPICALALLCLLAATGLGRAQAPARGWTATEGDVRVTCRLTVGGSFEARTTALTGTLTSGPTSSVLVGDMSVDLTTLDTGIGLRNQHLRENYLEVQKAGFETAVLSAIDVGVLAPDVAEGSRPFTARLRLHGTTQPVAGRVTFRRRGSVLRLEATFPVQIADYGIPDPRYLGVGVRNEVTVRVSFDASPS